MARDGGLADYTLAPDVARRAGDSFMDAVQAVADEMSRALAMQIELRRRTGTAIAGQATKALPAPDGDKA